MDDHTVASKSISPEKTASLQRALMNATYTALPTPLYEGSDHWGDKKKSMNGLKWNAGKPEWQYADKNQGTWRKYRVTLDQPTQQHLKLLLSNVQSVGNNTIAFLIRIEADVEFDVQQQNWQSGVKIFDGTAHGKVTVILTLTCESSLTIEPGAQLMPALKYRLKVVQAHAGYDHLTFTHLPGVSGSAAKVIGNWSVDTLNQVKPSLEKKLIDKLSQKIVKAADTKDIQVSLSGIERKK